jgi:hypothetical protein
LDDAKVSDGSGSRNGAIDVFYDEEHRGDDGNESLDSVAELRMESSSGCSIASKNDRNEQNPSQS